MISPTIVKPTDAAHFADRCVEGLGIPTAGDYLRIFPSEKLGDGLSHAQGHACNHGDLAAETQQSAAQEAFSVFVHDLANLFRRKSCAAFLHEVDRCGHAFGVRVV
jgi:hypothetical protein